jgi:hypothetical protein
MKRAFTTRNACGSQSAKNILNSFIYNTLDYALDLLPQCFTLLHRKTVKIF